MGFEIRRDISGFFKIFFELFIKYDKLFFKVGRKYKF